MVIAGRADWAGSGHAVRQAANRNGRFRCPHVTFYRHVFGYPADIVIPVTCTDDGKTVADYPDDYDAGFNPHAADTDRLKPLSVHERDEGTIGGYRPAHASTTAREDLEGLAGVLRRDPPG